MKQLWKRFYAAHVGQRDDLKLFIAALFLIVAALAILTYDVVSLAYGTANPDRHMPLVFAAGVGAIGLIVLKVLRIR